MSQSARKRPVPWDIIFAAFAIALFCIYIIIYFYWAELQLIRTWCQQGYQWMQRRFAHSLIKPQLRHLSLFAPMYTDIYPPHYHLNMKTDKEEICYKNCYETLFKIRTHREKVEYPSASLHWWTRWNLDLALKLRFEDIWRFAIRHIHVPLIQNILLWQESRILQSTRKERKDREKKLKITVEETYEALFFQEIFSLKDVERN